MSGVSELADELEAEFRVRSWWPGMDSFDTARGETEPHPKARAAATELRRLEAERDALADRLDKILDAISDPDEFLGMAESEMDYMPDHYEIVTGTPGKLLLRWIERIADAARDRSTE